MVSMKTEDHTGLYDHRQHPDLLPVRHQAPRLKREETAKLTTPRKQGKPTKYDDNTEVEVPTARGRMKPGDADSELNETAAHHQLRPSAISTSTSNARSSRSAHSMATPNSALRGE